MKQSKLERAIVATEAFAAALTTFAAIAKSAHDIIQADRSRKAIRRRK